MAFCYTCELSDIQGTFREHIKTTVLMGNVFLLVNNPKKLWNQHFIDECGVQINPHQSTHPATKILPIT